METLPVEILQRAVRYLPPRTFYGVVPRLSRRLRECSLDAIPGCPGGSVGVNVAIEIVNFEHLPRLVFQEEFTSLELSGGCGRVWTALTLLRDVQIGDFASSHSRDVWSGESGKTDFLERCAAFCSNVIPVGSEKVILYVSQVIWNIKTSSSSNVYSDSTLVACFEMYLMLVHNLGVLRVRILDWGSVVLGEGGSLDVPDTILTQSRAPRVQEIEAESADVQGNSLRAARLLHLFPSAHRLSGTVFQPQIPHRTDTRHLVTMVSRERRNIVTSVSLENPMVTIDVPALIELLNIYPNIEGVGIWIRIDPQVRQLLSLDGASGAMVRKLSISVAISDLQVVTAEELLAFSNKLIHQMPRLHELSIDVRFFFTYGDTSLDVAEYMKLGTLLDAFIQLFALHSDSKILISGNANSTTHTDLILSASETWPPVLLNWAGDCDVTIRGGKVGIA
ncbi:hypothetical protein HDU93_005659 [Gonapodya sp. JEL0774]|nr:hypothetical protein HDU93_005659 [Gonapodya sp. JEL0774]